MKNFVLALGLLSSINASASDIPLHHELEIYSALEARGLLLSNSKIKMSHSDQVTSRLEQSRQWLSGSPHRLYYYRISGELRESQHAFNCDQIELQENLDMNTTNVHFKSCSF